jgi:hypothetical protein
MRSAFAVSVATAVLVVIASACAKPPKAPSAVPTPMKLPADANAIEFTFTSGSCWGVSSEVRSIALGDSEVVISAVGFDGETKHSRVWWEKTRALLDDGLAGATGETSPDNPARSTCFGRPNSVCAFELRIATPRGEELLRGCCTEHNAQHVETAFRRLKPGSPTAAD